MAAKRKRDSVGPQQDRKQQAAETTPPQADEPAAPRKTAAVRAREAAIDAALEMSFPASDPPPWTP